jgi:hypothetical protein
MGRSEQGGGMRDRWAIGCMEAKGLVEACILE